MRFYFLFSFLGCCMMSYGQMEERTQLSFTALYHDSALRLGDKQDSIQIDVFKFYVSKIAFSFKGTIVWQEQNSFHLIDFSIPTSEMITLKTPIGINYDHISFMLGIDSLTEVSGVIGDDLDPTKGMYWTWQSGYIHLKLEGKCLNCHIPKDEFQFHIGGYRDESNSNQEISLLVDQEQPIKIGFDISQLLQGKELHQTPTILSPGRMAVDFAKKFSQYFYILNSEK